MTKLEQQPNTETGAAPHHGDKRDDPQTMLAELQKEIESRGSASTLPLGKQDEDLEALHRNLSAMFSPTRKETAAHVSTPVAPSTQSTLAARIEQVEKLCQVDQGDVLTSVTKELKRAKAGWERMKIWSEYIFSQGSKCHKGIAEQIGLINKALLEIDKIVERTLADIAIYQALQEKTIAPYRVIATNLAVDIDKDAILRFFPDFKNDM